MREYITKAIYLVNTISIYTHAHSVAGMISAEGGRK
jgi:hypothetical protein